MKKVIDFMKHETLTKEQRKVAALIYFPVWVLMCLFWPVAVNKVAEKNQKDIDSAPTPENCEDSTVETLCDANLHNIKVTNIIRNITVLVTLIASLFGLRKLSESTAKRF